MYEILSKAKDTKNALNLKSILVVFDQAIYSEAVEILWKHSNVFPDIIPQPGSFHTICVLLSIIGIRFGPAVLKRYYNRIWHH